MEEDFEIFPSSVLGGFEDPALVIPQAVQPRVSRGAPEPNAEDAEDASEPDTVVSIFVRGQRVGLAVGEGDSVQLCEVPLESGHPLVRQVLAAVRPAHLVVCKGADAGRRAPLAPPLAGGAVPCEARVVKQTDFAEEAARRRLLALDLEGVPEHLREPAERELWVASLVDFAKSAMIRAAGGLLAHWHDGDEGRKMRLSEMSAEGLVRMDGDAFQALQIFSTEFHPSAAGIGSSKEGFSLYSRFNRARSVCGRRLLRQWFLRPTNTFSVLSDRLDHVQLLRDSRHANAVKQMHAVMSSVKDVRRICTKILNLQSTCSDWLALRATLAAAMELRDMTHAMAAESRLRVLSAVQSAAGGTDLARLLQLLDAVIDFEQSKASRKLTVRAGVDPTLDELKNTYAGLGDLLTRVATAQMDALPESVAIESLSTVYFPMIGYAVVVPRDARLPVTQQIAAVQPYLVYQFDTESYIYFKSDITKELDEQLGDIHSRIVDRENQCIRELETHVLERTELMRTVTEALSELDCLLSLAVSSNELRLERPVLVDCPGLVRITAGRHLLQEVTTATFVPNDTDLELGRCSTAIITGPNASGKSVYLKQVGLIAFLAHIGSYVPAEACRIGLMDGLYTRIQTRESASVAKSSFILDLTQVATMMRHCTERSLLLLDEFGKGTDPSDGAALLGACLERITEHRSMCLATTHFSELLTTSGPGQPLLKLGPPQVEHWSMSYIMRPDLENEEGVVLLFKLRAEEPGSEINSMGPFCARMAGVPPIVVARALEVTRAMARGQPLGRLESRASSQKSHAYRQIYDLLIDFDPARTDPCHLVARAAQIAAAVED